MLTKAKKSLDAELQKEAANRKVSEDLLKELQAIIDESQKKIDSSNTPNPEKISK